MNWKTYVFLFLMVCALLWGAYYLGGEVKERDLASKPVKRDTVTVHDTIPSPPVVVTPNPAPSHVRPDMTNKRKVDSLLAVISDKDSALSALLQTQGMEQTFESKDPQGIDVSGAITVLYAPVEKSFATQISLDSLLIPVKTITITQPPIIEERVAWEATVITGSVCLVLGAFLYGLAGN